MELAAALRAADAQRFHLPYKLVSFGNRLVQPFSLLFSHRHGKPIKVNRPKVPKGHAIKPEKAKALPAKAGKPKATRKVPFQPRSGLHPSLAYMLLGFV